VSESDLRAVGVDDGEEGFDVLIGRSPTPAFAAEVAEEFRRLLERLGDDELQQIALLKMEGCTVGEIAARRGLARRGVERRLQQIRQTWGHVDVSHPLHSGHER
jgi:DNA-directed RNA polymerase specialized sigma24 family protein